MPRVFAFLLQACAGRAPRLLCLMVGGERGLLEFRAKDLGGLRGRCGLVGLRGGEPRWVAAPATNGQGGARMVCASGCWCAGCSWRPPWCGFSGAANGPSDVVAGAWRLMTAGLYGWASRWRVSLSTWANGVVAGGVKRLAAQLRFLRGPGRSCLVRGGNRIGTLVFPVCGRFERLPVSGGVP